MSDRRFRFSLRVLLLILSGVAVVAGVAGTQMRGRVQTRIAPTFLTDFSGTLVKSNKDVPDIVAFNCATEQDARQLQEKFDVTQFRRLVETRLERSAKEDDGPIADLVISYGRAEHAFFINFAFAEWGRYRLDVLQVRYVFDTSDPVAESRNAAVERAVVSAFTDSCQAMLE